MTPEKAYASPASRVPKSGPVIRTIPEHRREKSSCLMVRRLSGRLPNVYKHCDWIAWIRFHHTAVFQPREGRESNSRVDDNNQGQNQTVPTAALESVAENLRKRPNICVNTGGSVPGELAGVESLPGTMTGSLQFRFKIVELEVWRIGAAKQQSFHLWEDVSSQKWIVSKTVHLSSFWRSVWLVVCCWAFGTDT
jgi:hypothetical protein